MKRRVSYWEGKGVAQDYDESLRWFRKAADQRDLSAIEWLGDAYRTGHGVRPDLAEAIRLYCAAANGDATGARNSSMSKCGYGLFVGAPGVTPNLVESLMWSMLAVERSAPGDVHDRAIVNLNRALAQATPQQIEEAKQRAEDMRAKWKTNSGASSNTH